MNLTAPIAINDQAGLMQVDLQVQPNALGDYTLQILTGPLDTLFTDPNDFVTPLPYTVSHGSLTISVVPEPSALWLASFGLLGCLVVFRRA